MVDEQCMVIMNIVWWMNLQMYDGDLIGPRLL
jgi:hypothetical protein